jgi:type 1 glutamine amidotransferase
MSGMNIKKILIWLVGVTILALLGGAVALSHFFGFILVQLDSKPPQLPADLARPAVLVFSKANGFVHTEALPAGEALFEDIGRENGWSVYTTENGAVMNAEQLSRFDVVVWNNTSGTTLSESQQSAFREWLEQGGGFVGVHAAGGDFWYAWEWYVRELLMAQFIGHTMDPQFQDAVVENADPGNSLTAHLPPRWLVAGEEWYAFEENPRQRGVTVLLTLDETSYDPNNATMQGEHPIAWYHRPGNGRAFYSAIGHTATTYELAGFRELLARATAWAGDIPLKVESE